MTDSWPTELRLAKGGASLRIAFDDGQAYDLEAEYLRVESPSAEVKGHTPEQAQLVFGKRHVIISRLEPVGNYAVRIIFGDGHSTGLYTWGYLAELGRDHNRKWRDYLGKLDAAGKTRG